MQQASRGSQFLPRLYCPSRHATRSPAQLETKLQHKTLQDRSELLEIGVKGDHTCNTFCFKTSVLDIFLHTYGMPSSAPFASSPVGIMWLKPSPRAEPNQWRVCGSAAILQWLKHVLWPDTQDTQGAGVTWIELALSFQYSVQKGVVINTGGT